MISKSEGYEKTVKSKLLAIIQLEKLLSNCSKVYMFVAGGMRLQEPALDLGILMALVSGYKNRAVDDKTVVFGEVGLSGEVRSVSMTAQRIQEAKKLGFTHCVVPRSSLEGLSEIEGIKITGVATVREAMELI